MQEASSCTLSQGRPCLHFLIDLNHAEDFSACASHFGLIISKCYLHVTLPHALPTSYRPPCSWQRIMACLKSPSPAI